MILFRILCLAFLCNFAFASSAASQQVALTIDDLPSHGALPPGMTRADVAKSILKTLQDAHAPKVYGFICGAALVFPSATTPMPISA